MRANLQLLLAVALLGLAAAKSYDGYKVYQVHAETESANELLMRLEKLEQFDFWSKVNKIGRPVTVMAASKAQIGFERLLTIRNIAYEVLIPDVEKTVQAEKSALRSKQLSKIRGRITFDQYYQHAEINDYLAQLAADHPDLVSVQNIGQSYEGLDMNVIKISSGPGSPAEPKPVIFIDAGIHAREWIAPAVALYIINQLVENEDNINLVQNIDWIILPVLNPDGYEYTFSDDRFWRKTLTPGQLCDGVDANRNFGFHWMEAGASDFECADDYAGPEAFSEVEARNFRDFLATLENVQVSISFHSYAQMILYPYAYGLEFPPNRAELVEVGNKINDAIRAVDGTTYDIGSPPSILYAAAGASMDWAANPDGGNVPLVYTIELPGGGFLGFDLPPEDIRGVVEETWEGIKAVHEHVSEKFNL